MLIEIATKAVETEIIIGRNSAQLSQHFFLPL
jgi:hypothetical protein